ncbi:DNA polymerase I [Alphaproteobacteria bacterium]|nr:DNA polymerase I [Alphaproteobacteria bacterium]
MTNDKEISLRPELKSHDPNNLILIDGSGYIFRAFYGLPPMTNQDGVPVNAVFGFTKMLLKLIDDLKPIYAAVIFDVARKTFRNEIYEEYKGNRSDPPEDLIPQFSIIRNATEAIGLPVVEMEGFEADDLIATYATLAQGIKKKVIIISSDKDLMQLVDDNIILFDPMKQFWINEDKVFEKFGVYPKKVIDVQSLAGDSSDNIPGVPGIGVKTAAELINQFDNLDQLLSRAAEIKQNKRRENLIQFAEQARLSRSLVTLKKDVSVISKIEDFKINTLLDTKKLVPFLKKHGFKSLLNKYENYQEIETKEQIDSPQANIVKEQKEYKKIQDYQLIDTTENLKKFVIECCEHSVIAIDCETNSLNAKSADLIGISLSFKEGVACYVPLRHRNDSNINEPDFISSNSGSFEQIHFNDAIRLIKPLLENSSILKVGHNIKFDALVMRQAKNGNIILDPIADTMCISYVLDAGRVDNHKLDSLALRELQHDTIKFEEICGKGKNKILFNELSPQEALDYAAEDADITLSVYNRVLPKIINNKKFTVYKRLENPLINVLIQMEDTGVIVNPIKLREISNNLSKEIKIVEEKIFNLSKKVFNVGSPKQLGEILFDEMKITGGKKSKNGSWQTSVEVLENISDEGHPIAELILDWRHFSKLRSTYADALIEQINPETKRVHTSYSMVGASTGRLSSSNPNLQNIPIRTSEGRLIRTAFEPKDGFKLVSMDYSQIELRLIAHIADETKMLEAFNNDLDIHTDTASKVFGIHIDQVNSDHRRKAKTINFGIIYGISPYGLAKQLKCSANEAKDFINAYFSRFPRIRDYMEDIKQQLDLNGYVETLFKRRIYINGNDSKNQRLRGFAERQAINAPIQGTAADIIKIAMVQVHRKLSNHKDEISMLMQVHDELVFEINENKIKKFTNIILPIMETANLPIVPLNVKLKVDTGYGKNWAEAH